MGVFMLNWDLYITAPLWTEIDLITIINSEPWGFTEITRLRWGHLLPSVSLMCNVRWSIVLVEEILHHLGCIKPCEYWDKLLPTNWLAGFLLSTVPLRNGWISHDWSPHGDKLLEIGREVVVHHVAPCSANRMWPKAKVSQNCPLK